MNIISAICLLAVIVAAAVGLGYLYIGTPTGDILWKCLFWFSFTFALSFVPWGRLVGGPNIGRHE